MEDMTYVNRKGTVWTHRRSRNLGIAIVLMSVLAGCGVAGSGNSGSSAGGSASGSDLKVIWQPGDEQPFYYADAKNLWHDYGIAPQLIQVQQGTAELAALASKSADIALLGPGPFVSGVSKNIDMVAIYPTVDFASLEGLYVSPASGIKQLSDLVGKTVAVPFGSSADTGLRFALAKAGIPADKVGIQNITPTAMLAGFTGGDVQAAYIWSTWGQRLIAAGAKLVTTDKAAGVNAGPTIVAVRSAYLKSHPKIVACFIAAMNAGAIGANTNAEVAAKGLEEYTKVTPEQALTIAKSEHSLTIDEALSPTGAFSLVNNESGLPPLLGDVAKQLLTENLITSVPNDVGAYVSAMPAKQAQAMKPNGSCE